VGLGDAGTGGIVKNL